MTSPLQLPLRDIHLPPAPGWWPPAPGWWALAVLVLLSAALAYLWWRRAERVRRSAIHVARRELRAIRARGPEADPSGAVRELSVLLRRIAISVFPRRETAGLTGAAWLRFLDEPLPDRPFSEGGGRIVADAPYRREVKPEEVAPLMDLCESWIAAVAERGARR